MADLDILSELQPSEPTARRKRGLGLGSIVLLAGIAVVVIVIGFALARQQQGAPTSGIAPDFTIRSFDGETIQLSDLRGRPVVVNFWASWCGPCRDEAPLFQSIWERYRDQGVMILGITYVDDENDSRAFIQEFGLTYPNAPDVGTVISKELYFIRGVPETFVIDQNGNIVDYFWQLEDEAQLTDMLDSLLQAS